MKTKRSISSQHVLISCTLTKELSNSNEPIYDVSTVIINISTWKYVAGVVEYVLLNILILVILVCNW